MRPGVTLRPAESADFSALNSLISFESYIHRHLDWRSPLNWLGCQPFWVAEQNAQLVAALALPPDPPGVYWVRLFSASSSVGVSNAWDWLFAKALTQIDRTTHPIICAIALQDWFENLLIQKDFLHHQDIVVLVWNGILPELRRVPDGLVIRPMRTQDIPAVAELDQTAFENIWRHSVESLSLAFQQSGYSTVSEWNGKIVGYQISTTSTLHAHLARLAVHPDLQNHSIGFALVHDFLTFSRQQNIWQVTVNTQSDNNASLALYQKLGYERNGERYPVFIYPLDAS